MNYKTIKLMICTVLWTVTFSLGVWGTWRDEIRLMFWSGIIALVACVASGHVIAECAAYRGCRAAVKAERIRLETLAELMVDRANGKALQRADADLTHLPR